LPVRRSSWVYLGGAFALLTLMIGALLWFWDWNWLRPVAEARLSAAVGRTVTLERLDVSPGGITGVTAYGVKVANPAGFPGADFVTIPRLSLTFEPIAWLRSGQLALRTLEF